MSRLPWSWQRCLGVAWAATLVVTVSLASAQTGQAVRSELAAPIRAAQELLARQKWAEALVQLAQADKMGATQPSEVYLLERLRAGAAAGAGDHRQAAHSLALALASGQAPAADQPGLREALAVAHYQLKDWPAAASAASRALELDPGNTRLRLMLAQSQYLVQDFAGAARSLELALPQDASGAPPQAQLELLASCYLKLKNTRAYMGVLERLLAHHPKKDYWADLLAHLESQQGFARELAIDVLRLQFAVGAFSEASEYVDLAQQSLKAGFAAEALKVLETGVQAKLLGVGPQTPEHVRLLTQVRKLVQEDLASGAMPVLPGDPGHLFAAGYNRVLQGDRARGLEIMEQALQMPGLKREQDARLRLGQAWLLSGDKVRALEAFRRVDGRDGAGDLARLWALHAARL